MNGNVEDIIKNKQFFELTQEELKLVGEYVQTEEEFDEMKWFLLNVGEAFEADKVEASADLKSRVMDRLAEPKREKGIWLNSVGAFLWTKEKQFYQQPVFQMGLAALLIVGFIFISDPFGGMENEADLAQNLETEQDDTIEIKSSKEQEVSMDSVSSKLVPSRDDNDQSLALEQDREGELSNLEDFETTSDSRFYRSNELVGGVSANLEDQKLEEEDISGDMDVDELEMVDEVAPGTYSWTIEENEKKEKNVEVQNAPEQVEKVAGITAKKESRKKGKDKGFLGKKNREQAENKISTDVSSDDKYARNESDNQVTETINTNSATTVTNFDLNNQQTIAEKEGPMESYDAEEITDESDKTKFAESSTSKDAIGNKRDDAKTTSISIGASKELSSLFFTVK